MIDYATVDALESGMFVRISIPRYRTSILDLGTPTVLRFSDYYRDVQINGEFYQSLGDLANVTPVTNELRASAGEVSIVISGIPLSRLKEIDLSVIKGSQVEVWRGLFSTETSAVLSTTALGRFFGIVNNFSLEEEYDPQGRVATNTIVFQCSSYIDVVSNYVGGRRTSSSDQKKFYPNDTSFDRVTTLANNIFDFGAQK